MGRRAPPPDGGVAHVEVRAGRRPAGETWSKVDLALCLGLRGLPGGDTLPRLLRRSGRHVPERWGRHRKAKPAAP